MPAPDGTPKLVSPPEWRSILQFEGLYEVSNQAQVRNIVRGRLLTQFLQSNGYWYVVLRRHGQQYQTSVHSLVAGAFIGPRPKGKEINHIDSNRQNALPDNLEYVTHQENFDHARAKGRMNRGINNAAAKLTYAQVLFIRGLAHSTYRTHRVIAETFGVSRSLISMIAEGKVWVYV